jgi:hypothetical protein
MSQHIYSGRRDLTTKQLAPGAGVPLAWRCMGCDQVRSMAGSRGAGLRKRCAACIADTQGRKAK